MTSFNVIWLGRRMDSHFLIDDLANEKTAPAKHEQFINVNKRVGKGHSSVT